MNDEWLKKLPADLSLEVSKRLLHDMKELHNWLSQNPDKRLRPPISQAPWASEGNNSMAEDGAPVESGTTGAAAETATGGPTQETEQALPVDAKRPSPGRGSGKRPAKQPGTPGHGRGRGLVITAR